MDKKRIEEIIEADLELMRKASIFLSPGCMMEMKLWKQLQDTT